MAKGARNIPLKDRRDRLLAGNPDIEERIRSLLVEAKGTNVEPPCSVPRTRSKRTEYNWAKDPKGVYRRLRIRRGGKWVWEYVHRLAYILHYGGIPQGHEVCHLCHNRSCARAEHLWSATREMHRGKGGLDTRFHKFHLPILKKAKGKMIVTKVQKQPADRKESSYLGFFDLNTKRFIKKIKRMNKILIPGGNNAQASSRLG